MSVLFRRRGFTLVHTVLGVALGAGLFLATSPFLLGLGAKSEGDKLGLVQKLLLGRLAYLQTQACYRDTFSASLVLLNEGNGYFFNRYTQATQNFTYTQKGLGNYKVEGTTVLNFNSNGSPSKRAGYTLLHRNVALGARRVAVQPITGVLSAEEAAL